MIQWHQLQRVFFLDDSRFNLSLDAIPNQGSFGLFVIVIDTYSQWLVTLAFWGFHLIKKLDKI
jgi:hypothetical protein